MDAISPILFGKVIIYNLKFSADICGDMSPSILLRWIDHDKITIWKYNNNLKY